MILESNENPLILQQDGSIQLGHTGKWYNYTRYCINHVLEEYETEGIYSCNALHIIFRHLHFIICFQNINNYLS